VRHETLQALKAFLNSAVHDLGHFASDWDAVTPRQTASRAMPIDLARPLFMGESPFPTPRVGISDGTFVPSVLLSVVFAPASMPPVKPTSVLSALVTSLSVTSP